MSSLGLFMVMVPSARRCSLFIPPLRPMAAPSAPHPIRDIGNDENDVEPPMLSESSAVTWRPSHDAGCWLPLPPIFLGDECACDLAGTFGGSRGLRVLGRSWVRGLSRECCLIFVFGRERGREDGEQGIIGSKS